MKLIDNHDQNFKFTVLFKQQKKTSLILTNLRLDKHPIPMIIYEFSFTLGLALHCEYLIKKKKSLAIRFKLMQVKES